MKSSFFRMILVCGLASSISAQVVNISEPVLEQAIRSELNKPTDDITRNDLSSLTSLNLRDSQLASIKLPDGLISLESLNLSFNQLTSFTLPEDLINLDSLFLGGNQLTSFTFLKGLDSLFVLSLYSNQLTSLTLPDGLRSLLILDLRDNPIATLKVPIGLDLQEGFLFGFEKSDVIFYETQPKLRIRLDFETNKIAICWNSSADTSELESSSDFVGWEKVEGSPEQMGEELLIELPIDKNPRFFQLRRLGN